MLAYQVHATALLREQLVVPTLAPVGLKPPAPGLPAPPALPTAAHPLHWTRAQPSCLHGALVLPGSWATAVRSHHSPEVRFYR